MYTIPTTEPTCAHPKYHFIDLNDTSIPYELKRLPIQDVCEHCGSPLPEDYYKEQDIIDTYHSIKQ